MKTIMKSQRLPEPIFVSVKEDAYDRAEELALFGFAVEIINHGNVFAVIAKEDFRCLSTSQLSRSF